MDVFNNYLVIILSITISLFSLSVSAEDDYLLMLEAEAGSSRLDQGGKRVIDDEKRRKQLDFVEKKWQGECDYDEDVLQSSLPREEFSSYLKQCSLSLFVFYRRLDINSQVLVYEEYENASPIKFTSLKETIINYL